MADVSNIQLNDTVFGIKDAVMRSRWAKYVTVNPGGGADFTSVAAAVAYAKTICSATQRVLVLAAHGVYQNENVLLHPNPGVDIIGYGAEIVNNASSYPNTALFTTGDGYFEGLTFRNTVSNNYAAHVEKASGTSGGHTVFVNCRFISTNYAGLGVGMSQGQALTCRNCEFISTESGPFGGMYIHNETGDSGTLTPQEAHFYNCFFRGYDYDFRVDDANVYNGLAAASVLTLEFKGCTGYTHKARFGIVFHQLENYNHGNSNIVLLNPSGNDFPALDPYFPFTLYAHYYAADTSVFVDTPVPAPWMNVTSMTKKYSSLPASSVPVANIVIKQQHTLGIVSAASAGEGGYLVINSIPF